MIRFSSTDDLINAQIKVIRLSESLSGCVHVDN